MYLWYQLGLNNQKKSLSYFLTSCLCVKHITALVQQPDFDQLANKYKSYKKETPFYPQMQKQNVIIIIIITQNFKFKLTMLVHYVEIITDAVFLLGRPNKCGHGEMVNGKSQRYASSGLNESVVHIAEQINSVWRQRW